MIPRLHVPAARADGERVTVTAAEHHYVRHVLRLSAGAQVRVFDGLGHEWDGCVTGVDRHEASITVGHAVAPAHEPPVPVTLALGILKSDYMDDAVRDATMMGVVRVQPLLTGRSVVPRGATAEPGLLDRWRRIAIASARQSGRAVVPAISSPATFGDWLGSSSEIPGVRLLLAEPRLADDTPARTADVLGRDADRGALLLVGPEGGWEEQEVRAATAAGFLPWTVSRRTLRADAVSIAALAVLFYFLECGP